MTKNFFKKKISRLKIENPETRGQFHFQKSFNSFNRSISLSDGPCNLHWEPDCKMYWCSSDINVRVETNHILLGLKANSMRESMPNVIN